MTDRLHFCAGCLRPAHASGLCAVCRMRPGDGFADAPTQGDECPCKDCNPLTTEPENTDVND